MNKHTVLRTMLAVATVWVFAACEEFTEDDPTFDYSAYEQEVNYTIEEIKEDYATTISNSSFKLVSEDKVFEGYVVANDISGNLYQTLVVRNGDQAIVVSVNTNSLYATYPVGTHVRVNLNGLYVGGYGAMAKIGQPYYTSSGNLRLGGMLTQMASSNISIVGFNAGADEVEPYLIDESFLKTADKDEWAPMLVKIEDVYIRGLVVSGSRRLVYAMADDADSGNGVNDTILVGSTKLIMRASVYADFAYDTIPTGLVDVYGVLTRYSSTWQLQFRDINDILTD